MEETQLSKNTVRSARKIINSIGGATLFRFAIGFVIAYAGCLIMWAASGEPQIIVMRGGFIDIIATAESLKAFAERNVLFYPLLLLAATIIANIVPYYLCAKKLGLSVKGFFSKPDITGFSAVTFGSVALSISFAAGTLISLINFVLGKFRIGLSTPSFDIPLHSSVGAAAMILTMVIIAPVTEEFIFRGVVLNTFKKYGSGFAVVSSSLLWALMHGNIVQAVPVFGMGLILGVVALRSKSIIPSIIIHMINNLIATLALLAKASGNKYVYLITGLLVGSLMLAAAMTGITLFCIYHRQFFTRDIKTPENATAHLGSKAFLTSWTVILAIIIYSAYIITSVRPLG